MSEAERSRKLEFAALAHAIQPGVPLSWLWLLEWAAGQNFLFPEPERTT